MFGSYFFGSYYFGGYYFAATGSGSPDHLRGAAWSKPCFGGETESVLFLGGSVSVSPSLGGEVATN